MSELWAYIYQLQQYMQMQDKRVQKLEEQVRSLIREIQENNSRPVVHVDKIEYKFDQLKVETLEGTLNIGLNPGELNEMEEIQVNDHHLSPKKHMEMAMKIEDALYEHIEKDVPRVVSQQAKALEQSIDDGQMEMIKNDLKGQIPQRVGFYLEQYANQPRSTHSGETLAKSIIEQTKKDILQGIIAYLKGLKEKE